MGRGLGAILSVSAEGVRDGDEQLRELPVELIAPNPKQPRRHFDQDSLEALAGSLGERGVLAAGARAPDDRAAATSSWRASGAGVPRRSPA